MIICSLLADAVFYPCPWPPAFPASPSAPFSSLPGPLLARLTRVVDHQPAANPKRLRHPLGGRGAALARSLCRSVGAQSLGAELHGRASAGYDLQLTPPLWCCKRTKSSTCSAGDREAKAGSKHGTGEQRPPCRSASLSTRSALLTAPAQPPPLVRDHRNSPVAGRRIRSGRAMLGAVSVMIPLARSREGLTRAIAAMRF